MDEILKTIRKNERVSINLKPNIRQFFSVENGIDFNMDTLDLNYSDASTNAVLTIIYSDADGRERIYSKTLEKGGMSWMNHEPEENPNFGAIGFHCSREVFLDFMFRD